LSGTSPTYTARFRLPSRPGHWRCCLVQQKKIRDTTITYCLSAAALVVLPFDCFFLFGHCHLGSHYRVNGFTSTGRASEHLLSSIYSYYHYYYYCYYYYCCCCCYYYWYRPLFSSPFSYMAALLAFAFIYLDRLCHGILIGILYFLWGRHVRYDATCVWESKDLCYSLDRRLELFNFFT
jgi:uncharacterized protein YuzB (UPF0349 family)